MDIDLGREAEIQYELYHILREVVGSGLGREINGYQVTKVIPEVSADDGRADLVVVGKQKDRYGEDKLLVIEVKRRATRDVRPYKTGTKKAWAYAKSLNARYFAVCDGWFMLLFRSYGVFIGAYEVEWSFSYATNLLRALVTGCFGDLPKHRDKTLIEQRLIPLLTGIGISLT